MEDTPSHTLTNINELAAKGMWPNTVSDQMRCHSKPDSPQLRKRTTEEKKLPSIIKQDIGTGSAIPDHHYDLNTGNTDEQRKKESRSKEKPYVLI